MRDVLLALLVALTAFFGSAVGGWLNYGAQNRAVDAQLVQVAVGVLATQPTKETEALRKWAVTLLSKYAPLEAPLSPELQKALMNYKLTIGTSAGVIYQIAPYPTPKGAAPE
jgi:hypothetical protein